MCEKTACQEIEDILRAAYQTTDEYLLEKAIKYSNENKKKLLKRRERRQGVLHTQQPSGTPSADLSEAGPSGISSRRAGTRNTRPTLRADEPVIVIHSSSSDEQDSGSCSSPQEPEQADQTENSEVPTWPFSPISLPTSPVAPENASLSSCLLRSVPLLSILSFPEKPRKDSNNPHVTAPKKRKRNPKAAAPDRNEPETPPAPQNKEQTSSPIDPCSEQTQQPPRSVANSDLPPWKRYSRGLTNENRSSETADAGFNFYPDDAAMYEFPTGANISPPNPPHSIPSSPISSILNEVSQSSVTKSPVDSLVDERTPLAQQQTSSAENPGVTQGELNSNSSMETQGVLLQPDQNQNTLPVESSMAAPTQTRQLKTASVENIKPKMIQQQRGQSCTPKAPTQPKKRLERSASLCFRPGELSDTNLGEICLGRTRSATAKILQLQQTEHVFKQPTLRAARFVKPRPKNSTPDFGSSQVRQPSCSTSPQAEDKTLEVPVTDPLDQFRYPVHVPHRGLERSASMIYTPGQFQNQAQVRQTIPTGQQFPERNAAYKLRSASASNNESSQNINQHNSLQEQPNTERSASMIFTPGQLDHQSCSRNTQAANKTPQNVSKADPLDQFRYPKQVPRRGLERSASVIYTPGQFEDQAQVQQTLRTRQQLSERNAAYKLRSALASNTESSQNINQHTSQQARPNIERSASMIFTPGQLAQSTCENRMLAEELPNERPQSDPLAQFRYQLPKTAQNEPNRRAERSASVMYTPGQFDHQSCSRNTQAANKTPENVSEADPLDQFRYPKQVPRRGLERSASVIYTPGQFEDQARVGQTIPTGQQFSERNTAYKLRSALAGNTESSHNINQQNSLQEQPNIERSASMIFTPGQLDHQSCSRNTQAANKTPENVSEADPLDQFRYPKQVPRRGLERSASVIYTPGQFEDQARVGQTIPTGQQFSERNTAYKLRSALAGNTESSHNINQQNSLQEQSNIQRSASMIFTPGQLDHQSCSRNTQAANKTPENVSEADPLDQFRYPKQVPRRGLERSASVIYTPGQFEDQARVGQTIPTGQQFTERNTAYKLRSALAGNTESSHNINQQNSLQEQPNIERSASMIFTPGQLDHQSCSRNTQAANKTPENVSEADPMTQFMHQLSKLPKATQVIPYTEVESSASMKSSPGQLGGPSCNETQDTPTENAPEPAPMAQCRYHLRKTTHMPNPGLQRSASRFSHGQFENQMGTQVRATQPIPTTYGQDATAQFNPEQFNPNHNTAQSAPMDFTQAQRHQFSYPPPPISQQIPVRAETGCQHTHRNNAFTGQELTPNMLQTHFSHTAYSRPPPTQHTDHINPPNFMHTNNQWVQPPAYNTRQTSNLNWHWQNNNQPTEQTAHNYGHTDKPTYPIQGPTQATSTGQMPHYYTRQARAAFDAAGHNNAYNAGIMQTPAQASQYAPQAQYTAYNPDAAYQEQLYMAAALPPPRPPPLYVCRHCSKPYKTHTGLKNHLRRICQNPYHRYPMR